MRVVFENSTDVSYSNLKNIVSNDDLRPVLQGAYIDLKNHFLVVANSHILMMYPIKVIEDDSKIEGKIVPIRYFNQLKYMLDIPCKSKRLLDLEYVLTDEFAEVYWLNQLVFRTKYIEGKYPDYQKVIKDEKENLKELNEIGLDLNMLKKIADSIPDSEKKFKFNFFGNNRHVIFKDTNCNPDRPIKGLIMPYQIV
jgi:DNA polymerase III sliding clamp (beta) subunit (PCNA family)